MNPLKVSPLPAHENSLIEAYKKTKLSSYPKPSVTPDIVFLSLEDEITKDGRIVPDKNIVLLLIRRKDIPYKDYWALPGGFFIAEDYTSTKGIFKSHDSNIEEAAVRELMEETGLSAAESVFFENFGVYSEYERDPRLRVVSVPYVALLPLDQICNRIKAGSDAQDVGLFTVTSTEIEKRYLQTEGDSILEKTYRLRFKNVDSQVELYGDISHRYRILENQLQKETYFKADAMNQLAFDHVRIIDDALEFLKTKSESPEFIFSVIPKPFTLTQFQKAYEAFCCVKMTQSNFYRKFKMLLAEVPNSPDERSKSKKLYMPRKLEFHDFNL